MSRLRQTARIGLLGLAFSLFLAAGSLSAPMSAKAGMTDEFVFHGLGYGHGVGMSQWGAWAAARQGIGYPQILGFYYEGTELSTLDPPNPEMIVRLSSEPEKSVSSITQNFTAVMLRPSGAPFTLAVKTATAPEEQVRVAVGEEVALEPTFGGGVLARGSFGVRTADEVAVRPDAGPMGPLFEVTLIEGARSYGPRTYRGKLKVEPSATPGYLAALNYVALEGYIRAIAEVYPDWAKADSPNYAFEAVKAQAVAARTYALANRYPYLNDNQWDQVYRGYDFEAANPGIREATEATRDWVLRYQGVLVSTYYSSNSGGYTTVWGESPGYLRAKPDPWSLQAPPTNPGYAWNFTVSQDEVTNKVNGMSRVGGGTVSIGTVRRIEVAERDTADPGSHVRTLEITGSTGNALIKADDLRAKFGYASMRSTLFSRIDNPGFVDVPPEHMYYDEIMQIADAGLVNGYPSDEFRPDHAATRWQFAKMAVGLRNALFPQDVIPLVDVSQQPFADVPIQYGVVGDVSDWVAAAKGAGIVQGVTAQLFDPYRSVRRDQVASMIVRAMGWEDEAAAYADQDVFVDVAGDNVHRPAANYLNSLGILRGYSDPTEPSRLLLKPDEPIARMHIAALLSRILGLP